MHRFNNLKAATRLLISILVAALASGIAIAAQLRPLTGILLGWDVFCATMILGSVVLFFTTTAGDVRRLAQRQDEGRYTIFLLVLGIVCISLVGILLAMKPPDPAMMNRSAHRGIALAGVGLSWILLHTMFTLRYAHLFYTNPASDEEAAQIGGLEFPGAPGLPDYPDFAYFAFIIGMTFQVSDVSISSRQIRRVVLLHSLLSFVFNTIIVALAISALSSLGH